MKTSVLLDSSSSSMLEGSLATAICEIVNSPRSLTVALLLKDREHQELKGLPVHYDGRADPWSFGLDYLCTDMLKKSVQLDLGIDRRAVAVQSFFDCETTCSLTNHRLTGPIELPSWVFEAQRFIRKVLPPLKRQGLDYILHRCGFGPGTTTGVRGTGFVKSDKIRAEMHLTPSLYPYARSIMGDNWANQVKFKVVPGSKFTTVPKNSKTDRGIDVQPTLNGFLQKGIGSYIRKRLRMYGVDLNDQSINQQLAEVAELCGFATIDLSAASDMISYEVVRLLLPPDWFHLLDICRTECTTIDGKEHRLEKFSAMGNAYTFELESLIFYAVCVTVLGKPKGPMHVYGDDIIVPQDVAHVLIDRLEFLGFQVNHEKSFLAGRFFESCGADFYNGVNVRPFYISKDPDKTNIPYALQMANALRHWSHRQANGYGCVSTFHSVWKALKRVIPYPWNGTRVPAIYGDQGVIHDVSEIRGGRSYDPDIQQTVINVKYCTLTPRKLRKADLATLYSLLLVKPENFSPPMLSPNTDGDYVAMNGVTTPISGSTFTKGYEPMRGLFGKVKTRSGRIVWPDVSYRWI